MVDDIVVLLLSSNDVEFGIVVDDNYRFADNEYEQMEMVDVAEKNKNKAVFFCYLQEIQ